MSAERAGRLGLVRSTIPAFVAAVLGCVQVYVDRSAPLDPDVLEFQHLAQAANPFLAFRGVLREPLWPLLLAAPVHLFESHSDIAIRVASVAGFVFMVIAFQLLAGELFGGWWAFAGALSLAISPWLVFESARGLREEASGGMIMLVCLGLVRPKAGPKRFVVLFALAGLSGLLRWDSMVVVLPVLLVALVVHRPAAWAWVVAPLVLVVIVAPLVVGSFVETGDPLYFSNEHAKFFRNIEFHDQPGFPTSAELATNSFAGPPITWGQYVLGLHSPSVLAGRAVRAFVTIPIGLVKLAVLTPDAGNGRPIWMYGSGVLPAPLLPVFDVAGKALNVAIVVAAFVGGLHRFPFGPAGLSTCRALCARGGTSPGRPFHASTGKLTGPSDRGPNGRGASQALRIASKRRCVLMRLDWRDAAATVLLAIGLTLALAAALGWNWPFLGGVREGIVALAIVGFAAHLFGSPRERFYYTDPFALLTMIIVVGAMAVSVIGGLITGSVGFLVALMLVTAIMWGFATLRHAVEGRPATPHVTAA